MKIVFALLIAFQVKHFLADYPLQNRYMLGKFKDGWAFFWPLMAHAAVHGFGTFLIGAGLAFLTHVLLGRTRFVAPAHLPKRW